MKLNPECIRQVLLELEDKLEIISFIQPSDIEAKDFSREDVDYSLIKLLEAGYLKGKFSQYMEGYSIHVNAMTWSGHEFLDNIRDSAVWSKTKTALSKFSSVSIGILSQVASSVLANMINGTAI